MESDWQRRSHMLHESPVSASESAPALLPTLPGVAELIASSRPATDCIPAYKNNNNSSNSPNSSLPPILPPTSSGASILPHVAYSSSSPEQLYSVAPHHQNQVSPSESHTSNSPPEQHIYPQSQIHPATGHYTPVLNSKVCSALQDTTYSQTPINGRRQDSAIAHQCIGPATEALSFAAPSESNFLHRRRSDTHYLPSTGPPAYSILYSLHPTLPPPSFSKSHEYSASPAAASYTQIGTDSLPRTLNPSPLPDQTHTNNTRQQRYNVRFAANHTPATMPSVQRSRNSPPLSTIPLSSERSESPVTPQNEKAAPTIEPAIQAITRNLKQSDDSLHSDARARQPSVERCSGCNESWSRPLPSSSNWILDAPTESATDFARATDKLIARIRQYGKDADQRYEQWKEQHSRCPPNGYRETGPSLHHATFPDPSQSKTPTSNPPPNAHTDVTSNKRKSEVAHGDSSKIRKVTFDNHAAVVSPVRPSAPI
ncbi:hypothetical protein GQ44DRAFT_190052 [Phaeosphaeriaceae sp. PMI808]|nr:hypothetical protein GQ44DRAFT_190052 [Phaeosphaeriaceae sp. PMI808]